MNSKIVYPGLPEINHLVRQKPVKGSEKSFNSSISSFETIFQKEVGKQNDIKISLHAQRRLEERKISLDAGAMEQISQAVNVAEAKGARDSLLLFGDLALIASINNKTIVTALDKEGMKNHVFTNIDSAVIIK